MLVQNGANIDARDGFFYTPLHLACVNGAVACVKVLLLAGADPSTRAQGGVTPLIAARKPKVRELVKEALAARKNSLWEVDVSGRSTVCGGSEQGDGEEQAGVGSGEINNSAASVTAAGLAAAISAVLPTSGAAEGMNVEGGVGGHGESETTWEGFRGDWDPEVRPTPGPGALAAEPGKAATPRGGPMSRLPGEKESRRSGISARPRRSSTGSMLEKLFNSSSGPYQPQKVKDEVAAATAAARMESISLASAESSTESSTESGDSRSQASGAGSAVPMESDGIVPDACEAAFEAAAEVPAVPPAQMIPEIPLHLAPRRPPSPSPPRSSATTATTAAAVAGKTAETVVLEVPRFVGAPLDNASASAPTLPRVVSAEDGDVQAATTDAAPGSTGSLSAAAAGGGLPLGDGPEELAPAAPATDAGSVARAATNTAPVTAVARGGGEGGGREDVEPAEAVPSRVRAKKRRAKSLPPSTRRDRRPRGPRPCLEGPAAVIKTLTLEDDDADDGEAWALSQWLHGATASVTAAAGDEGGGGDSPPPSPSMLPMRRATTLVG